MSHKLLYTTHNDLSEQYFTDWQVIYYDSDSTVSPSQSELVYFRDPFNDPTYAPDAAHINQLILHYRNQPSTHIIDQLTSYDDVLRIEDKYQQAQTYGALYPRTWLPSQHQFIPGKTLAKPRISQRAKDILFQLDGRSLDDTWIIQDLLDIQEELRVYVIYGQILPIASIKSSKSSGKVKVMGTRPLSASEHDFVAQVTTRCPLDVVGYDIAVLPDNKYCLIEANRSPQFRRYTELTGINLAELIADRYKIDH